MSGGFPDIVYSTRSREEGILRSFVKMDEQENPLEKDHSLCVVLPGGLERKATVHGR